MLNPPAGRAGGCIDKLMKIIQFKSEVSEKLINKTIDILRIGGLVIAPSDTVYGLLVDATSEEAVKKLSLFKNRPLGKPISIFVTDLLMLKTQVDINKEQLRLVQALFPGPFTVVLPSKHLVVPLLESERGTLGVRIPDYEFVTKLVKKFGKPISATSANLSGRPPHYSVKSLLNTLPEKKKRLIDLIIDNGQLPRNRPSTVIDLTKSQVRIIRYGDIVFKDIKTFITKSPTQTKKVAQYILKNLLKKNLQKPLVFILEGELGVGKTIFIKGIGEYLGLKSIISPSFVIYYEYVSINPPAGRAGRLIDTFVHVDLYNIQESEEFKYLGLEKYFKEKNIVCIEWGEKAGEILNLLREKGKIVYVKMRYINNKNREIEIKS